MTDRRTLRMRLMERGLTQRQVAAINPDDETPPEGPTP